MTIRAGFFSDTHAAAATGTSASWQVDSSVPDKRFAFLVTSDVAIHLFRTPDAAEEATAATTENAMRIPAATPILINGFASDWLSWIKGDGEDDGSVWITRVDH